MPIESRSEAQRRADEIRAFRRELELLEREGVLRLDPAQRETLARHHDARLAELEAFDIDRDAESRRLSIGMRIASFFGALALGASVFFLFYQFWGGFGTRTQVAVLLAAALGTFLATGWTLARDASGYFARLAAMVAFACFVLDLVMLGQIFGITPSDNALLVWAAYALLLAYACDARLLQAAGIVCLIAFVGARTGTFSGMYWLYFGTRPENFFPAAALIFAVPLVVPHRRHPDFAPVYRVFGLLALFLPILVLSNWGQISYLDAEPRIVEGAYQLAGFALAAGAAWLGTRRGWRDVANTGVTFFVIFLYTKFFDWWWQIMPKWLFFFVIGLTSVLFLVVLLRLRKGRRA